MSPNLPTKTIETFYRIYRAGAFHGVKTQAYRAVNFLQDPPGGRTISAKNIQELVGSEIEPAINPLDLIDELIFEYLNEVRSTPSFIKHYNLIRELSLLYKNHINNLNAGESNLKIRRGKQRISTGVKSALDYGVPTKVIEEHAIPIKVLRDKLISTCFRIEDIRSVMLRDVQCVWITKAEDLRIPPQYRSDLPDSSDRYELAGIEIYPKLVKFTPAMLSPAALKSRPK